MFSRTVNRTILLRNIIRYFSEETSQGSSTPSHMTAEKVNADVPGLSHACIAPATQPVGPGVNPNKTGAYKVPEYFCYNTMSYFEAEIEMSKFRCPQPSALKK